LTSQDPRAAVQAELERTSFQRKVVTQASFDQVVEDAVAFFQARGYRAGRTGRPNQLFVMGGREGGLPRVTAEILIQTNIGKRKTTMLSISGAGERLAEALAEYAGRVRSLPALDVPDLEAPGS
jgi:hypothetical protein